MSITPLPTRTLPQTRDHGLVVSSPRLLLAVLAGGTCLQALLSSGFAVAIPAVREEFSLGEATAWVVAALYIATGVGAPVTGRLADVLGPRRVFTAGLLVTVLGALLGTWAPDLPTLLLSRVLLGIGSSAQFPAALAILRAANAAHAAPLAQGLPVISGTVQLALAAGPLVGGIAVQVAGWRAVTALAIPLALAAMIAALRVIPRIPPAHRERSLSLGDAVDVPGMIILASCMTTGLVLLLELHAPRWWLVAGLALQIALLVWWERRALSPFLDLVLLRTNRVLTAVYVRTALVYLGLDLVLYGLPVYLQEYQHHSPLAAGALLLPLAASAAAGIWVAGRVLPRWGSRWLLVIAALLQVLAGLVLLATLTGPASNLLLVATVILLGVPVGLHNLAHQARCVAASPPGTLGTTSGLLRAGQYLGSCAAAGILVLVGAPAPVGMVAVAMVTLVLGALLLAHSTRTAL